MESEPYLHRDANAPRDALPIAVFFREEAVKNERASLDGAPVYDRVVYARLAVAGSRDSPVYEICRTFEDGSEKYDRQAHTRFKGVFEEWRKKQAPSLTGFPLEEWPGLDVVLIRKFKDNNVFTVEQLAGLNDGALDTMKGLNARVWRGKAQQWLSDAKEIAGDTRARAEIEELRQQLAETQSLLKEALKKGNALGYDAPKRGRGKSNNDDVAIDFPPEDGEARV